MRILVTGTAGFIGFHLARRFLENGHEVIGFDNLNSYYDVTLKESRLAILTSNPHYTFKKGDLADRTAVHAIFQTYSFDRVVNLAAQAGVRYSLTNPYAYVDSNLVGFVNILEECRQNKVPHLVYASSSSVYGANLTKPYSVHHNVDHPLSLYAATKKANELMAHSYSHLFKLPVTGLRFFTVYGPWGRPDMAVFLFTKAILSKKPIEVFNFGKMRRDFTYIDDIIEGVVRVTDRIPSPSPAWVGTRPDPGTSLAPYRIYNIGNNQPTDLLTFIALLEEKLGCTTEKIMLPMQPGDVPETAADVTDLANDVGFSPATPVKEGIAKFVDWYLDYYQINPKKKKGRINLESKKI